MPLFIIPLFFSACGPEEQTAPFVLLPAEEVGAATRPANPPPFWWGVSTSSFQTEDRRLPSGELSFLTDWDAFGTLGLVREPDDRIGSFSHFERDLAALKYLGVTHYRVGIEWARIEPTQGEFNESAIEHYVRIVRRLKEEGIEPLVCLWHFTFPSWLGDVNNPDQHGWLHPHAADAWGAYLKVITKRLAPYVELYAPINEPNAYAFGMMVGFFKGGRVLDGPYHDRLNQKLIDVFMQAAGIIRDARSDAKIVSIQSITAWRRDSFDPFGTLYKLGIDHNYSHLDGVVSAVDYVGINYYQRAVASPLFFLSILNNQGENVSDIGWVIDAEGLEVQIVEFSRRYHKPIIITENGVADRTDRKRQNYIYTHLLAVRRTLEANYDVRGYFHWTLVDSFEWLFGYDYDFGLFRLGDDINQLTPKASADYYRSMIASGFMDHGVDVTQLAPTAP
ncbi:MAG: glycoside hydrolase family 1 protein [Phycisphaerae bacterium]|nr:glycoside hydrolase family 1 protein [Phycisphaerae bacterium]